MFQSKTNTQEKINNNTYPFINIFFAFLPISFVFGSFFVNVHLLLFCCLGIFYLKSKILTTKFDFSIKIIFLFFLIILFSTSLGFLKSLYFDGLETINTIPSCHGTNCFSPLVRLTKAILFFRFFLFLLIVYLLNKFSILNFKYFFLTSALTAILISLDIIYQYIFGFNIAGLKNEGFYNSCFFCEELIAGGFIQRFAFFAIFFTIFIFKNKNYTKFISTIIVICILGAGILFSGSRMPLILFILGFFVILLSNFKIKKILFLSLVALFVLLKFTISSNEKYEFYLENTYESFARQAKNILSITGLQKWKKSSRVKKESLQSKTSFYTVEYEGLHRRIYLAAIETWKTNKIFGNGIKSFRQDCWKLAKMPDVNLSEDLYPGKKNLLCSNHPHNYYLEILVETGIVGFFIVLIIGLSFIVFIFKNFRSIKQISIENSILLSVITSLILETLPLRSTGSLFSTNNTTYLILISSIILCHKTLLEINKSK